jgi:Streptomyces sporulation and cell division protein, SsgA
MRDVFKESVAQDVRHDVTIECVDACGNAHTLDAAFGYDPKDPYAVTMTFYVPGDCVVWTFGRELLLTGLHDPAGDGDVHVWPEGDTDGSPASAVMVELCSPDGHLLALVRGTDVQRFLNRTYDLVPVGNEEAHLDLDSLLTQLLAS